MNHCPVCQSDLQVPLFHRNQVPVHQNLVIAYPDAARGVARGILDMAVCNSCGFVCNRAFDQALLSYGEDYDNTQSCSPFFDGYLDGLVRHLVEERGMRNQVVVEVGCGKGQFLRKLVTYPGAHNRGLGFDPSYVGPRTDCDGSLEFHRCYYGPDCANFPADAIICRHVIEHVAEPLALLESIKQALAMSPGARVYFETPCVEWILGNQVIWDFFYEHCSLFSAGSLTTTFERAGFTVETVRHIFGGQYLWLEAVPSDAGQTVSLQPGNVPALASAYAEFEAVLLAGWRDRLVALHDQGPVSLWGAGAKGATFANLADPDCRLIDSVVDINPNKQGKYLPGTGHPIIDYRALPGRGVRNVILMNPNYRDENMHLLAAAGVAVNLVDWS